MKKKNIFKKFDKRVEILQAIFLLFVLIFSVYLFLIQVIDIGSYRDWATNQRVQGVSTRRGEIVDRNGFKLASDELTFDLWARPEDYDHTPKELAEFLAPLLNLSKIQLEKKLSDKERKVISIKKGVDRKTAELIKAKKFREISYDVKIKRIYPQGVLASHVLGYYNPNNDYAGGVELTAKDDLIYTDHSITYEKTGDGKIIYKLSTNPEDLSAPVRGKTLQLTIDSAIQHICEKYLYKKAKETNARRGAVIVMEPSSGEILAMAVYPYYDPNEYNKYSQLEMKNWALTDVYAPGSTFKTITVASGLISGKINKYSKINDTGKIKIGWHTITNYDYNKFPNPGFIDLTYLLMHSSNVGAVRIALMIDKYELYDILKSFNFGAKTGIDLPGESSGILRNPKKWGIADHGSMGHGYGASVTAIQMAAAVYEIANKGVWVTPHIIKYKDEELEQQVAKRRVMEEQKALDLTKLLVDAIDGGRSIIKMDDFQVAAKTGTSRRLRDDGAGFSNKLYTSIVGFLPASDPKVLIYVIVDSPSGAGIWGSTVAGPIFKDIAVDIIKILNLRPDKNGENKKWN